MIQLVRPKNDLRSMSLQIEVVPAYDLLMSLVAASHAARYELSAEWARSVKSALPPPSRRDLAYFFADPAGLGTGPLQLIPDLSSGDPSTFISALQEMDPAHFAAVLLGRPNSGQGLISALRRRARGKPLSDTDERRIQEHAATLRAATRRRFREILDGPEDVHLRFVAMLEAHHAGWFMRHYGDVASFLEQRAKQGRRSIGKLPAKEVIARVTRGFTLQSPAARSVQLVPSYYTAPFVMVVRDDRQVVLVYGTRPKESTDHAQVNAQTVKVLKALADETRLRILQLLVQRPMYGQQIAETLGVSHPTVSHHMAQLRIVGLTRTELGEDGNKTYSVRPDTVELLCAELRAQFGETAQAIPGEA